LVAGVADLFAAARRFTAACEEDIPLGILSFVFITYLLLGLSPLILAAGLAWQDMPHASKAFVQAAKLAMLGGLAAGLASEVLSETADSSQYIPEAWDRGCSLLGTASGLLLLGLYGVQADLQVAFGAAVVPSCTTDVAAGATSDAAAEASPEATASPSDHSEFADEENGLATMGCAWTRRWSGRQWSSDFPQMQAPTMLPPETCFGFTSPQGGCGLATPLLLPPPDAPLSVSQDPWSNDDFGRYFNTVGLVDDLADQMQSQLQTQQARRARGSARRPPVCRSQQEHAAGQTPSWPVPMH